MSNQVQALDIAPEEASREWWRGYGFTGRLSEMDYYLWFQNASVYYDDPDFVPTPNRVFSERIRMANDFELLRESEFILENFFKLPNILRQCVEQFASVQPPVAQIEEFVRLALLLPAFDESAFASDGKSNPLIEVRSHLLDQVRLASSDSIAYDFECSIEEYISFSDPGSSDGLMHQPVLLILALVYGIPFVLDLLQQWTLASFPGSHADFVAVVEGWEDSFSEFPLHWIVNLVREGSAVR